MRAAVRPCARPRAPACSIYNPAGAACKTCAPDEVPIVVDEAAQRVSVQAGVPTRMLLDYLAAYTCAPPRSRHPEQGSSGAARSSRLLASEHLRTCVQDAAGADRLHAAGLPLVHRPEHRGGGGHRHARQLLQVRQPLLPGAPLCMPHPRAHAQGWRSGPGKPAALGRSSRLPVGALLRREQPSSQPAAQVTRMELALANATLVNLTAGSNAHLFRAAQVRLPCMCTRALYRNVTWRC